MISPSGLFPELRWTPAEYYEISLPRFRAGMFANIPPLEGSFALNAFNTLAIGGLVQDADGRFQSITLTRCTIAPLKGVRTLKPSVLPNGPPPSRTSCLPPPGYLKLALSVGDIIGDGRCGTIYSTTLVKITNPSNPSFLSSDLDIPLPELVLKVAEPSFNDSLLHEASVYQEMESLQGVVIPRCYGWFEADIGPLFTLSSTPPPNSCESGTNHGSSTKPTHLSVLLLERVGDLLPLGEKIPDKSDIWAIFSDISQLGIEQPDMRYSNILLAPSPQAGLRGQICPYHNRVHKYRIIDFDRARKTDWTLKQHYFEQVGTLGRLLEMMELGFILEPWEY